MKIGIVSQYYAPEDARIPTDLARSLRERGHSVRVITAFPSYPRGQVFDGYRQSWHHIEDDSGVRVRRVPTFVSHSQNPITRILTYLSFALASTLRWRELQSADVIYVYATQMTAAIGPAIWKAFGGPPFVLHVQDLWPESVTQSSLMPGGPVSRLVDRALTPWLRSLYRRAAGVIAIAPTMRELLTARGADPESLTVIPNWANEGGKASRRKPEHDRTSVVYAGNFAPLQSLDLAIRAAAQVVDLEGFRLTLIGSGVSEQALRHLTAECGASNVRILDRVPRDEMDQVYAESDYQLVTLQDLPIFRGTIPSKVQNSLNAGVPMITNVAGDVTSIVSDNRLGIVCEPGSIDSLVQAFRSAHAVSPEERASMGQRCRDYYDELMSLGNGVHAVESVLRSSALSEKQ